MFWTKRTLKWIGKLNCGDGDGGGDADFGSGDRGSDAGVSDRGGQAGGTGGSGGNVSGAATGFGADGYGDVSAGMPGIFGGGVLGGVPGVPDVDPTDFTGPMGKTDPTLALAALTELDNRGKLHSDEELSNNLFSVLDEDTQKAFLTSLDKGLLMDTSKSNDLTQTVALLTGLDNPLAFGFNSAIGIPGAFQTVQAVGHASQIASGTLFGEPSITDSPGFSGGPDIPEIDFAEAPHNYAQLPPPVSTGVVDSVGKAPLLGGSNQRSIVTDVRGLLSRKDRGYKPYSEV